MEFGEALQNLQVFSPFHKFQGYFSHFMKFYGFFYNFINSVFNFMNSNEFFLYFDIFNGFWLNFFKCNSLCNSPFLKFIDFQRHSLNGNRFLQHFLKVNSLSWFFLIFYSFFHHFYKSNGFSRQLLKIQRRVFFIIFSFLIDFQISRLFPFFSLLKVFF